MTLYTVESVKQNVSRWVAVDGGMSDNLRPMLYGARYEAHVADRFGGETECVLAGKHCESGDVIVREALLDDPRPGDVIVTPATGAYGYAMANNYNGVPRPPVIFCPDGDARVVVRRESFDDLTARDVPAEESPRCRLRRKARPRLQGRPARPRHRRRGLRRAARGAGRGDRALQRPPAGDQRRADARARATSRRSSPAPTCSSS